MTAACGSPHPTSPPPANGRRFTSRGPTGRASSTMAAPTSSTSIRWRSTSISSSSTVRPLHVALEASCQEPCLTLTPHSHQLPLSLSLSVPYAGFNAVRLPLGAWHVTHDVDTPGSALRGWSGMCGARYKGWRALPILDDIIRRLRARGILVMLDLHRCVRLSRLSAHTFKLAFTGPSRTGLWPPCGLLGHTYKCSTSAHL